MANLIIHIRSPKTATTSLQIALSERLPPKLAFLGADQPRERNGRTGCHVLNDWVRGVEDAGSKRLSQFLDQVSENRRKGFISIVVQEVLLDSSQGMRWDRKIEELGKRVSPLEVIPAITLRNPIDGILSLQREFRATLRLIIRASPTAFSRTHQAQVFNYRYLLKCLWKAGFDEVLMMPFDQIVSFGLDLRQLGAAEESARPLQLGIHNTKGEQVRGSWLYERSLRTLRADYQLLLSATSSRTHCSCTKIRSLLDELGEPL